MKLNRNALALAVLGAVVAPAAHAEITIDNVFNSEVSFEGLVQADAYSYSNDVINLDADAVDGSENDAGMRRAELVLKGKGPGNIEWVLGYDASAGKFLDVNAKYKIGGNKNHFIQIGQFKQPNSLEELSSTKNNDFVAKANITNLFGITRRVGATYNYGGDNWAVAGSVFGRELTRNRAYGQGFGLRGYWAPINEQGNILHLGLSYIDQDTDADTIRLRSRPNADLSNRLIDSGTLRNADRQSILGAEAFWVHGPFKLQGEYMRSKVDRYGAGASDYTTDGGYISGVWNVTGETWGYKAGTPTTPLPDEPATGMWQLGLRYDTLDLNDGVVHGGKMNTITAGVNWYWHSNFKFMLNYVKATSDRNGLSDDPSIVEARAQFYW